MILIIRETVMSYLKITMTNFERHTFSYFFLSMVLTVTCNGNYDKWIWHQSKLIGIEHVGTLHVDVIMHFRSDGFWGVSRLRTYKSLQRDVYIQYAILVIY